MGKVGHASKLSVLFIAGAHNKTLWDSSHLSSHFSYALCCEDLRVLAGSWTGLFQLQLTFSADIELEVTIPEDASVYEILLHGLIRSSDLCLMTNITLWFL